MMFPNAVGGHMPFVPSQKQKKSKRDREKNRHHSGPDRISMDKNVNNTTHSMPVLYRARHVKPNFVSLPVLQDNKNKDKSFFSSIIKMFQKKKEAKLEETSNASPRLSIKVSPKHGAPTAAEIFVAKRQRTRTNSSLYSNAVMEAIQEIDEPHEEFEEQDSEDESSEDSTELNVIIHPIGAIDIPRPQYLREDSLDGSLPGGSLD